ncbi:hypothetical protein A8D95_10485 [Burkholderia cenocepacia]|uniref:Uncharacterized protein n=1 Tax=Burkholderia cenocepacia TaxID=95486 RepID=A0A1V2VW17_9BURK|nr:hypothetical protein A8D61_37030 [Burkholderia cenocepacia]AQQ40819.1 hypothetical protein A8E75_17580 [Burkholderia cenocepacia]AQQ44955.1 hypothetical protein A8F32_03630 [Burkholderia cenocepacia]ARF90141.1 uncharacterized protein BCN122_III0110 [Burkholderia cenocepacia]ONJ05082.1 hypothetical protein A8D83_22730 [Burkholderia cenocepacia]
MGRRRRGPLTRRPASTPVGRLLQHDAAHCYHSRHAAPVPGAANHLPPPFASCMRTRRAARCRLGSSCQ